MEEHLFSIECVTCQRKLAVRDESIIGAIVTCAKCGSMVQVVPPPDWKPRPKVPPPPPKASGDDVTSQKQESYRENPAAEPTALVSCAPIPGPPPVAVPSAESATDGAAAGFGGGGSLGLFGLPLKWVAIVGVPIIAASVGLVAWGIGAFRAQHESVADAPADVSTQLTPASPAGAAAPAEAAPDRLDRRWLPEATRLVLSLRMSALAERPECQRAFRAADGLWQPSVGRVLDSLRLVPRSVRRFTWAAADLAAWHDAATAVIELEEGQDASGLRHLGQATDLKISGKACRCLASSPWPHPFAVLDARTIVTGRAELLRELADRSNANIASQPIDRLLNAVSSDADGLILVDLLAARDARWPMPTSLWDVWPAGRGPWHVLCEVPQGIGVSLRLPAPGHSEIALACDGETTALKVHAALDQLKPATQRAADALAASLTKKLEGGRVTAREADQYDVLLKQGRAALATAKTEIADPVVWVRMAWGEHLAATVVAALDSQRPIRADWLDAVRIGDEANHRRLATSLGGYVKAEGFFPTGAGGGSLLPPETRLSWIASMLPYFDHRDWHRDLQFPYSWNSTQNRPVTQRRLDAVVNPALGPSTTEAGFPVTHYVGVAGVGADAADLKVNDPRAGLFGYSREPRLEDITDGASNTLATLGVSGRLGPWAAGGDSTVRALTKPPYVNGPDGFGSGQPNGMLAGMADGSVRFVSKNVDPLVLEQLATIRGGEKQTVAALMPSPADTIVAPQVAKAQAAEPSEAGAKPPAAAPGKESKTAAPGKQSPAAGKPSAADEDEGGDNPLPGSDEAETVKVDVAARLADRVADVHFPAVPMIDAVRFTSQMSTVPVSFDVDWMRVLGVQLHDRVTARLSGATTAEIFESLVSGRGLTCEAAGGQLLVTAPLKRRGALRTEKYNVADLTGKDPAADAELSQWIVKLVAPETWRAAGGPGNVQCRDGVLTVAQTDLAHYQVRSFCDRLRIARGKSPEGRPAGDSSALATHVDLARAKLNQPITVSLPEPVPLARIAAELERLSQTTILFDGVTLAASGISPQRKATLSVNEQPLYTAMLTALRPMELTYRIVDGNTLEVTTPKSASARLEVEFYPVAGILAKGMTPEALIERIKAQLAGGTWNDAGGPGVILFDKASKCLLVLQSQPIQARLQILLGKL